MEHMERIGTRTLDELGRILLPSELRAKLSWTDKDTFAMYYVDRNTIMLQLMEKQQGTKCVFCGTAEALTTINGKDICGSCSEIIKKG